MRVLITGGTGFVGSHTVAALLTDGHDVRMLVRSPDKIAPALEPLGLTAHIDYAVGDVTDPQSIVRAIAGCDAVVHAASVYKLDTRAHRETRRVNVRGTETVLRIAADQGCDPIIHVSSMVAVLRREAVVGPDAPLATARGVYIRSKAQSEGVARQLQGDGAPVVIVQPGSLLGPHDPHLSDQSRRLRDILKRRYPLWPREGVHLCDVRDTARVHAAALKSGGGPRRYIVPGRHVDGRTLFNTLRAVTGRRLPCTFIPATALIAPTWVASAAQRIVPFHVPAEHEGAVVLRHNMRCDDSRARTELGVEARPLTQTLTDAVRWLHAAGHVTTRQAGLIANPRASSP